MSFEVVVCGGERERGKVEAGEGRGINYISGKLKKNEVKRYVQGIQPIAYTW